VENGEVTFAKGAGTNLLEIGVYLGTTSVALSLANYGQGRSLMLDYSEFLLTIASNNVAFLTMTLDLFLSALAAEAERRFLPKLLLAAVAGARFDDEAGGFTGRAGEVFGALEARVARMRRCAANEFGARGETQVSQFGVKLAS
jgi:hypothetical protein